MNSINFEARSAIKQDSFVNHDKEYRIEEGQVNYLYQIGLWKDTRELVEKQFQLSFHLSFPKLGQVNEIINDESKIRIFSVQPNKYMIESDHDISDALSDICDNVQATLINQSSALTAINVIGTGAKNLIKQLCFFDFSSTNASVINTQVASAYNVTIELLDNGYRLLVTRTMARSLWQNVIKLS